MVIPHKNEGRILDETLREKKKKLVREQKKSYTQSHPLSPCTNKLPNLFSPHKRAT
jgi:hypothetical protein